MRCFEELKMGQEADLEWKKKNRSGRRDSRKLSTMPGQPDQGFPLIANLIGSHQERTITECGRQAEIDSKSPMPILLTNGRYSERTVGSKGDLAEGAAVDHHGLVRFDQGGDCALVEMVY
jgi:hypothetical protein